MSAVRPPAPEGVTFDTNVYLQSADGLEVVVSLKEAAAFPTPESIGAAIDYAFKSVAGISDAPWQVMSRDEIADYKRRNDSSECDEDDEEEDF